MSGSDRAPRTAGVVCEGPTEFIILERVVRALWPEVDQVLPLQPQLDATRRAVGASGFSGVRKWCQESSGTLADVIDAGIGPPLDLLVIALDVDAAIQVKIEDPPASPSSYDAGRLCRMVRDWLAGAAGTRLPAELVIALPAMEIEAWAVAALLKKPARPETIEKPSEWLVKEGKLSLDEARPGKVRKSPRAYDHFATEIAARLPEVRRRCPEADRACRKIEQRRNSVLALGP